MAEDYFVGINTRELDRLKMQHDAWLPETMALWQRAGFRSGMSILDAGCGPGFTSLELAKIVGPSGKVCALDKAKPFLRHLETAANEAKLSNLTTSEADITAPNTLDGNFDGVFTRWFLAFLIGDLKTVLAQIHRTLKPKGVIACMEYLTLRSTTCSPPCLGFDAHTNAWIDYYLKHGGDTEVGASLPSLLHQAGFEVKTISCVGGMAKPGERWWSWWFRLVEDFGTTLVEGGLMTAKDLAELQTESIKWAEQPNSFIYTPIIAQIVAVKR